MHKRILLSLTICSCLLATSALGNDAIPTSATLDAMGLSGLAPMTDHDASLIRGKGYVHRLRGSVASVWGNSFAHIGGRPAGASSENGYKASGRRMAEGSTSSMANSTIAKTRRVRIGRRVLVRRHVVSKTFSAGGSSFARAR